MVPLLSLFVFVEVDGLLVPFELGDLFVLRWHGGKLSVWPRRHVDLRPGCGHRSRVGMLGPDERAEISLSVRRR
jgi:hypothetical protein